MIVSKFLKEHGYDTVPGSFYSLINVWESWYASKVRKFHRYRIYNGKSYVNQQRYSLGMAKKVSEDIADLLMNERVQIVVQDKTTDSLVKKVLIQNKADVRLNEYQERKAYTGTVAYVPYIDGAQVAEDDGTIIPGAGKIKINYVSARNIYPLSWCNGEVSECAFVFTKTINSKQYAHIQIHALDGTEYVIYNYVVEASSGSGKEIPSQEWKGLKGFENLANVVHTGCSERQFVIDRLNIVNNTSEDNPMGISIFANAVDVLKGIDVVYDSYINEFSLGKKRVFVAPEALGTDEFGNPIFDENDIVFYKLPEDSLENGKPITELNMDIRAESHNRAINDNLNILSLKCGFGSEHYKFENGNITTATQVISENSDMYRMLKKHEIILEAVIKELVRIICRLCRVIGVRADPDSEVTIDFDDSIIEDKASERKEDRQDVSMGAMLLEEYRAKWYGETLTEAATKVIQEPEDGDESDEE